MTKICISLPENENFQDQWDYVLNNFQVDELYVKIKEPFTDDNEPPISKAFKNAKYILSYSELPKEDVVLISPANAYQLNGETNLETFTHSDNCIYLFGADEGRLTNEDVSELNIVDKVYVETSNDLHMFSFVAGAVVLYDKKLKYGQSNHG